MRDRRVRRRVTGWATHPYNITDAQGVATLMWLHRATKLPIWNTEYGTRDDPSELWAAVRRTANRPWIRSFSQYTLRSDWFGTGLLTAAGKPRSTLRAFVAANRWLRLP